MEVFLLIFHLFHEWTAFFTYYETKFGIYQDLLAKTISIFSNFFLALLSVWAYTLIKK